MLELYVAPKFEPITYAQMLNHLRVEPFDESIDESSQEYVNGLIAASRNEAEAFTHRSFITQTWRYYLQDWPAQDYLEIPKPPLISVSSIKYTDLNGTQATLSASVYTTDTKSLKGRVVLKPSQYWPTTALFSSNPIVIEFVCGYGPTPEDVPAAIRHAIMIAAGDLWDNRSEYREVQYPMAGLPRTSQRLLYQYIVWSF